MADIKERKNINMIKFFFFLISPVWDEGWRNPGLLVCHQGTALLRARKVRWCYGGTALDLERNRWRRIPPCPEAWDTKGLLLIYNTRERSPPPPPPPHSVETRSTNLDLGYYMYMLMTELNKQGWRSDLQRPCIAWFVLLHGALNRCREN